MCIISETDRGSVFPDYILHKLYVTCYNIPLFPLESKNFEWATYINNLIQTHIIFAAVNNKFKNKFSSGVECG